ncbi:MAG: UbiH/UbiF/VisC/COQ6 family ubiquinone biosynthesis hydroxylase [Gammaproteobacteria bacterium]|nr:UbiH/UbiF/VisC/COQ6 family ubiquinone biosynthesis hydroxylase [Gammaproteobacteria bacterium]
MTASRARLQFDVVIVGAGAIGTAFACALRNSGLQIALVDAREPKAFTAAAEVDLRVFALSPASRCILESLGAWQIIQAQRLAAYTEMHVWDSSGSGCIHFDCADVGEPALGYIVENRLIQHALLVQLHSAHNITAIHPATPESVVIDAQQVTLSLHDGRRLQARLLVAADGADSATRKLVGIDSLSVSYGQTAIVAHVVTQKPHDHTAWQRFLPTGPIALLPLQDGRSSVVWSLDDARAEEVQRLDDAGFCAAVTTASDAILGQVTASTPRAGFPLQRMHASEYVQARCALIGDAAHALHPLAGQGVNMGFKDMAALSAIILDAQQRHRDVGDLGVLRCYQRARKGENLAMITALDGIKRLFSNDIAPLTWMRNAGLCAVDRFTPLKSAFMRRAMGLRSNLTEPMR